MIVYGFIIIACIARISLQDVDTPSISKTDENGYVRLTWNLTQLFDRTRMFSSLAVFRGLGSGAISVVSYQNLPGPPDEACTSPDSRVTCIIPDTTGHTVGFSIINVNTIDAAEYESNVNYGSGGDVVNQNRWIYVFQPPLIQLTGITQVIEGDAITLTCTASSQSLPASLRSGAIMAYTWVITNQPNNHVISLNTVTIATTTKDNNGATFRCQAKEDGSSISPVNSNTAKLDVQYSPYAVSLRTTDLTVTEGDDVSVLCGSDCSPTCLFTWTRLSDTGWSQTQPLLTLPDISRQYHDQFMCQAENTHGKLSEALNITVNYASEITLFSPSKSGAIVQGDTLDITCVVTSRPDSDVTISNTNTSDIKTHVEDKLTAVYSFNGIQVLDSAVYACSASNGITPMVKGTREITLSVKGGFGLCEAPPSSEGVPLHANVTISICLSANPFTQVSSSNWQFDQQNSGQGVLTLPAGASTATEDTSHMYKKYIQLMIHDVLVDHYGTYNLTVRNMYNTGDMVHRFVLVPEGKPESPTDLDVTHTSAVSIYLRWMAGFDGGPEQTFWLYVTDVSSGTGFMVSDIPDTTGGQGGLMTYTLTETHGLIPDHSYYISVGAVNRIGNMTNPSMATADTNAKPSFEGDEPQIIYTTNTAEITWFVNNLGSLTHILIDVCISDSAVCGTTVNITSPEIQPYIVPLPEGEAKGYVFSFTFYDVMDIVQLVQEEAITDPSTGNTPKALITGVAIGGLLLAGLAVVLVILWRKGIIPKEKINDQHHRHIIIDTNGNDGHVNSAMTEIGEISPYGTSENNPTSNAVKSQGPSMAVNVANAQAGPLNGDIYSAVNKKPKNEAEAAGPSAPTEYLYSEVNKPPKAPKPGEAKPGVAKPREAKPGVAKPGVAKPGEAKPGEAKPGVAKPGVAKPGEAKPGEAKPGGTKPGTSRPVSVFPPALTPSSPPVEEMYAKVNKDKTKPVEPQKKKGLMGAIFNKKEKKEQTKKGPAPEGQQYENVELTNHAKKGPGTRKQKANGKKTDEQEMPYANVLNTGAQDGVYSEVQIPHMEGGAAGDNMYANTGNNPGPLPFMRVGKDGVLYAELDIINKPPAGHKPNQPDKIHGEENRTEYASINVDKLKKKK